MRRYIRIGDFPKDDGGAAVVELTLALPFILLLAAGLSEFGLMISQQQIITKSVRDAARYAARSPIETSICPLDSQLVWSTIVADSQNLALSGNLAGAPLLISTWNSTSMVAVTYTDQPTINGLLSSCGGGGIPRVTVTATLPYAGIGFLSFLGLSSFNLTASHTEMWTGL